MGNAVQSRSMLKISGSALVGDGAALGNNVALKNFSLELPFCRSAAMVYHYEGCVCVRQYQGGGGGGGYPLLPLPLSKSSGVAWSWCAESTCFVRTL
eukprot:SAG11_NODE_1107_length_5838_cov_3.543300_2_plen_97_part_00